MNLAIGILFADYRILCYFRKVSVLNYIMSRL